MYLPQISKWHMASELAWVFVELAYLKISLPIHCLWFLLKEPRRRALLVSLKELERGSWVPWLVQLAES